MTYEEISRKFLRLNPSCPCTATMFYMGCTTHTPALLLTVRDLVIQAYEEAARVVDDACWCASQYAEGQWEGRHDKDCPHELAVKIRAMKDALLSTHV